MRFATRLLPTVGVFAVVASWPLTATATHRAATDGDPAAAPLLDIAVINGRISHGPRSSVAGASGFLIGKDERWPLMPQRSSSSRC